MAPTQSAIVSRLTQYAHDVESFMSNPSTFLKKKQADDNDIGLNALVFLTISAALSAFLEVHPDSPKPQDWWQLAWESFRAHVFPSVLFAYLQALAVPLFIKVSWRTIFAIYAYALGVLIVLRSITVTIVWDSIGVPGPVQDSIICAIFMIALTGMVLWGRNEWLRLSPVLVISTVLFGYIAGMFEMAVKEPGPKIGFFEPVVLASRALTAHPSGTVEELRVGVNYGALELGDAFASGKYEDTWTFSGTEGNTVEVMVSSRQFDTYARIETGGVVIGENDDDPRRELGSLDSRAIAVLPSTDQYTIVVTSYESNGTGDYIVTFNDNTGGDVQGDVPGAVELR